MVSVVHLPWASYAQDLLPRPRASKEVLNRVLSVCHIVSDHFMFYEILRLETLDHTLLKDETVVKMPHMSNQCLNDHVTLF